jgi:hypothetical protein
VRLRVYDDHLVVKFNAVQWDDESDPTGNVAHIAEHGLTTEEVESVLRNPNAREEMSRSSGRKVLFRWTNTNRFIMVAYKLKQTRSTIAVRPITAYPVDPF